MYASGQDVCRWLASIPPSVDAVVHRQGRRKRQRRGEHHHLPSPGVTTMAPSSPTKRRRDDADGDGVDTGSSSASALDNTPRPNRAISRVQRLSYAGPARPSSVSSPSNRSSVSNRSSPAKQYRNAEMQETGFHVENFEETPHPESLRALRLRLRDTSTGYQILPASLQNDLRGSDVPHFAFSQAPDDATLVSKTALPSIAWVRAVLRRAGQCKKDRESEASWNMDVHAPILEQAFRRDRFSSDGLVDFRFCPTAQISPAFRPRAAPSKMVDFCLFLRPGPGSCEEEAIDKLCESRPELSINHTDWGNLCKHPIALSIETKRPGEQGDAAILQMGTWHSSQWRALLWDLPSLPESIDFLPGIIIQGNDWHFVATTLDGNGKARLFTSVRLGGTDSELNVYCLLVALHHLRLWIETVYWPAFRLDILGLNE